MPQETKSHPDPGAGSFFGLAADTVDDATARDILDKAFDYRGDVTLTLRSGLTLAGYLFDRRAAQTLGESSVRIMPADSDEPVRVPYSEIARVEFSGRDPAHGKSFETWVKKFTDARLKGESASIH